MGRECEECGKGRTWGGMAWQPCDHSGNRLDAYRAGYAKCQADVVAFCERWERDTVTALTDADRALLGTLAKAFASGQHVGAAAKAGPK